MFAFVVNLCFFIQVVSACPLCSVCPSGITAREHGSNKKLAAQSCALSLVRQLYHLGVIEAYSGVTKKKDGETVRLSLYLKHLTELCCIHVGCLCFTACFRVFCVQLEVFEVSVSPDLQQQLASFIQELGVHIPSPVSHPSLSN